MMALVEVFCVERRESYTSKSLLMSGIDSEERSDASQTWRIEIGTIRVYMLRYVWRQRGRCRSSDSVYHASRYGRY